MSTYDKEYGRKFRLENRDKLRAYDRQRNRTEARRLAYKEWYKNNSGTAIACVARWAKANPQKVRLIKQNTRGIRRARIKSRPHENINSLNVYELNNGICGLCGEAVSKETFEIDHIIPIAKGGGHVYGNVHIAHRHCNRKKGASLGGIIFSI